MAWRPARSITQLFSELNRIAPSRSTASDGIKGDSAHAHRKSWHNPVRGIVYAADVTHDPRRFDAHVWARQLASRRPAGLRTIISAGQKWENGRWRRYNGENGHYQHTHVDVYDDRAWLDWGLLKVPAGPAPSVPPIRESQSFGAVGRYVDIMHWEITVGTGANLSMDVNASGQLTYGPWTAGMIHNIGVLFGHSEWDGKWCGPDQWRAIDECYQRKGYAPVLP